MLWIEGGDIGRVVCADGGEVHIFDEAFDDGVAHFRGKLFVYAEEFFLDGQAVSPGRWIEVSLRTYVLEYSLSDGSSVVANIDLEAWGELILVPEPATVLLLGLGGLALVRKRKRER